MKFKIQISTNDKEINIPIISRTNPLGYDDNIQNIVDAETDNSINTVTDEEIRRIKIGRPYAFNFKFWNGFTYVTFLAPSEFNPTTDINTTPVINSFFIVQVYDSYLEETQTKRHTGYYNGYDFGVSTLVSSYYIDNTAEFSDLYLPKWYLDTMSGNTTLYVKFLFYSGKSGKFYPFYNGDSSATDQRKMFHTITVNPSAMTYTYTGISTTINSNELLNTAYNTLVNNTVPSFPIQKTTYPSGTTFTSSGTYVDL
jgi:hypothetical protein